MEDATMHTADRETGPSLVETLGRARHELLRIHLLITDLRVYYWMTLASGMAVGILCLSLVGYAVAQIAGHVPTSDATEAPVLIVLGVVGLGTTAGIIVRRMAAYATLLRVTRHEADVLTRATEEAEMEGRSAIGVQVPA
jgi:hypothetical protein